MAYLWIFLHVCLHALFEVRPCLHQLFFTPIVIVEGPVFLSYLGRSSLPDLPLLCCRRPSVGTGVALVAWLWAPSGDESHGVEMERGSQIRKRGTGAAKAKIWGLLFAIHKNTIMLQNLFEVHRTTDSKGFMAYLCSKEVAQHQSMTAQGIAGPSALRPNAPKHTSGRYT